MEPPKNGLDYILAGLQTEEGKNIVTKRIEEKGLTPEDIKRAVKSYEKAVDGYIAGKKERFLSKLVELVEHDALDRKYIDVPEKKEKVLNRLVELYLQEVPPKELDLRVAGGELAVYRSILDRAHIIDEEANFFETAAGVTDGYGGLINYSERTGNFGRAVKFAKLNKDIKRVIFYGILINLLK